MRLNAKMTARPLMLALAAGALSLSAWAQSPATTSTPVPLTGVQVQTSESAGPAGSESSWREQRMAQRQHQQMERRQQRQNEALASLARDLQLQPAQQAAWQRFEQAMKSRPTPLAASASDSPGAQGLPARVAELKARKAQRDAAFEQRLQAALDLHGGLDKAQQQVLDERAGRWLQHMGGRHGGDHRHPPGQMRKYPHARPA